MADTCKSCKHWQDRMTEDDGFEHGYGRHKLEDGTIVDAGICLKSEPMEICGVEIPHMVMLENNPACEKFESDDNDVLPWD